MCSCCTRHEHEHTHLQDPRDKMCPVCRLIEQIESGVFDADLEDILEAAHGRKRRLRDRRRRGAVRT